MYSRRYGATFTNASLALPKSNARYSLNIDRVTDTVSVHEQPKTVCRPIA